MNHRNHDTSPGHNGPVKPAARRDYKDSVFRMLFRDRTNLLSLYNAVNQTSYTDPEELAVIKEQNLYETICTRAVNYACALTEELLDEG